MSSFAASNSPPHPTKGIGQGVISDILQRQTQSSRTTSIHILDNDSLLNIFYLYRPAVTLTGSDDDDDDRIGILMGTRWDRLHWWYKHAHVCRRWRNLILGSASFLGLTLVCTFGTPIADMLVHSPPLPLAIEYGHSNITAEDEEGLFLALEQPNRIRCIRVVLSPQDLQKFVTAIDDELPILEYLVMGHMTTGREDDPTLVFPETIQAPHLRHLVLIGVDPPVGSRLLTTAVGLVTLCLSMHDSSIYLNPNYLLQCISCLPRLEMLVITFFNRDVETQLSHTPTITHATLPNLRRLSLEGVSAYIEVLIRHIATPRLEKLHIIFFDQHSFSVPCLVRIMNIIEIKKLRFDVAEFEFSIERVRVERYPHKENRRSSFNLGVDSLLLNGHISSMAQIINALGQVFSEIVYLILEHEEDSRSSEEDLGIEVDSTEWLKLLRPFSNVKYLRVDHGLVEEFSRYLRSNDGELPPELLPELQVLTYSGRSTASEAFTSFLDARQNAGRPVSLVRHGPPSPPAPAPSISRQVYAVRRFLESIQKSKEREEEWLSTEDTAKMVCIFQNDATAAEFYITIADHSKDETIMRLWVQSQLESTGIQRGGNL